MSECYCSSCGSPIPDGQGRSCSMCYGDIAHGKDGYYQDWAEQNLERIYEEQLERDLQTHFNDDGRWEKFKENGRKRGLQNSILDSFEKLGDVDVEF